MSIALLPESVPCIDADPVSFLIGGVGVGRALDPARCMGLRLHTRTGDLARGAPNIV